MRSRPAAHGHFAAGLERLAQSELRAVERALAAGGKLIFTGIGKNAPIAAKIAANPYLSVRQAKKSIHYGLQADLLTLTSMGCHPLSVVMILVVSGIGSLIHLYSTAYMHDERGSE